MVFRRLFDFLIGNPQSTIFTVSLCALSIGCAMERLSLGLIVPGGLVVALMVYSRLRGE